MARQLRQAGWSDARALVGGWNAWLDANLPIERKPDEMDLVAMTGRTP